ncbi:hypothetical protein [Exilibacterium tricleocarpae]|nr:hypothetical protein [Exilibacterium tricleocarpae]
MKWKLGCFVLCLFFLVSSCSKPVADKNLLLIPVISTETVGHKEARETLDEILANGNQQNDSALIILSELFTHQNAKSAIISVNKITDDDLDSYGAIIISDHIPDDDLVSGYRYDLTLKKHYQQGWKISELRQSWRCWPGRGHREFSIGPCK